MGMDTEAESGQEAVKQDQHENIPDPASKEDPTDFSHSLGAHSQEPSVNPSDNALVHNSNISSGPDQPDKHDVSYDKASSGTCRTAKQDPDYNSSSVNQLGNHENLQRNEEITDRNVSNREMNVTQGKTNQTQDWDKISQLNSKMDSVSYTAQGGRAESNEAVQYQRNYGKTSKSKVDEISSFTKVESWLVSKDAATASNQQDHNRAVSVNYGNQSSREAHHLSPNLAGSQAQQSVPQHKWQTAKNLFLQGSKHISARMRMKGNEPHDRNTRDAFDRSNDTKRMDVPENQGRARHKWHTAKDLVRRDMSAPMRTRGSDMEGFQEQTHTQALPVHRNNQRQQQYLQQESYPSHQQEKIPRQPDLYGGQDRHNRNELPRQDVHTGIPKLMNFCEDRDVHQRVKEENLARNPQQQNMNQYSNAKGRAERLHMKTRRSHADHNHRGNNDSYFSPDSLSDGASSSLSGLPHYGTGVTERGGGPVVRKGPSCSSGVSTGVSYPGSRSGSSHASTPTAAVLQAHRLAKTGSLNSNGTFSDGPCCRICRDGDGTEVLISPCYCAGSMGLIHISCLQRWLGASNNTRCEICHFQFSLQRKALPFHKFVQDPGTARDKRNVICDMACFVLITPLTLTITWLCISGALKYYNDTQWEKAGLISLSASLLLIYTIWFAVVLRHNVKLYRDWQMFHQEVTLLGQPPPSKGTQTETPHQGAARSVQLQSIQISLTGPLSRHKYANKAAKSDKQSTDGRSLTSMSPAPSQRTISLPTGKTHTTEHANESGSNRALSSVRNEGFDQSAVQSQSQQRHKASGKRGRKMGVESYTDYDSVSQQSGRRLGSVTDNHRHRERSQSPSLGSGSMSRQSARAAYCSQPETNNHHNSGVRSGIPAAVPSNRQTAVWNRAGEQGTRASSMMSGHLSDREATGGPGGQLSSLREDNSCYVDNNIQGFRYYNKSNNCDHSNNSSDSSQCFQDLIHEFTGEKYTSVERSTDRISLYCQSPHALHSQAGTPFTDGDLESDFMRCTSEQTCSECKARHEDRELTVRVVRNVCRELSVDGPFTKFHVKVTSV